MRSLYHFERRAKGVRSRSVVSLPALESQQPTLYFDNVSLHRTCSTWLADFMAKRCIVAKSLLPELTTVRICRVSYAFHFGPLFFSRIISWLIFQEIHVMFSVNHCWIWFTIKFLQSANKWVAFKVITSYIFCFIKSNTVLEHYAQVLQTFG